MSACLRPSCALESHPPGEHAPSIARTLRALDTEFRSLDVERAELEHRHRRAQTALVRASARERAPSNDARMLTAREAGEIARVSPRWFYRHASRYPWILRTSGKRGSRILVDEAGLRKHLERSR